MNYLDDTPRLRQLYYDYKCYVPANVRLQSLNYAMKIIRSKKMAFNFLNDNNLREIIVHGIKVIFVYEYCLSKSFLMQLLPDEKSVIVNLHNWNGESCISKEAYREAEVMNVSLFTVDAFRRYINDIR